MINDNSFYLKPYHIGDPISPYLPLGIDGDEFGGIIGSDIDTDPGSTASKRIWTQKNIIVNNLKNPNILHDYLVYYRGLEPEVATEVVLKIYKIKEGIL
jgi:hypothetical protein